MYLLDTNIVSDVRKRQAPVLEWMQNVTHSRLFLSAITLGEVARGAARLRRKDPKQAERLNQWREQLSIIHADSILPVTEDIAVAWGHLSVLRTRDVEDGLIAATAIVHDLTLVTRNVSDFEDLPISLVNPWALY